MAKLVPQNNAVLHAIAKPIPVKEITSPKIQKVLKDMRAALHSYNVEGFAGVAIAAPQVGIPLRIFLVEDMNSKREEELIPTFVAINPEIIKKSRRTKMMGEGCLSVPDAYGTVSRSLRATIRAYDEHGKVYTRGGAGLLAQIFQHEVDHLDGTLFVDRAKKIWHKHEEGYPKELSSEK